MESKIGLTRGRRTIKGSVGKARKAEKIKKKYEEPMKKKDEGG